MKDEVNENPGKVGKLRKKLRGTGARCARMGEI
jgi:hypothetical protein